MAIIKKDAIGKLSATEINVKISELEKAMLELQGEGRKDKIKPVRKTIARLKTRLHNVKKT